MENRILSAIQDTPITISDLAKKFDLQKESVKKWITYLESAGKVEIKNGFVTAIVDDKPFRSDTSIDRYGGIKTDTKHSYITPKNLTK